ncbi:MULTISPECIES: TniQ family protein [Microbacterium]|uniref:TniQ family protein n=1 Tax=Microbacterium sp. 4NA327F11 TaxID=2502229 RepID=UPI0010F71F9A|nr:TniQ family protein [Microbacterium sp. 4NA327F11]MCK9918085.1 TniQ family protein [Microbacteriaceae bacterium K1510]
MTSPARWPLHPPPSAGEALSSWLTRIAAAHRLRLDELLADNLGTYTFDVFDRTTGGLDITPPRELLVALEQRTGRDRHELWGMSIAGNVPWLLDDLEPSDDEEAFHTYVRQHHVLLTARERPARLASPWRAWLPREPLRRACPTCIAGPERVPGLTLVSQLPLTLSCPRHGCYLESAYGSLDTNIIWVDGHAEPRPAPPAVRAMDQRSADALRVGIVRLPRRDVHAGIWFRMLRTIIDELSTSATHARTHAHTLREVWASIEQPIRGGLSVWRSFELLDWSMQQRLLEAAAAAIAMIEDGTIRAPGTDGALFLPAPHRPADDGRTPRPIADSTRTQAEPIDYWKAVVDSFNEVVSLALADPAQAELLYRFVSSGPGGPNNARRILADIGITEYASSQNIP